MSLLFNRACSAPNELEYLRESLASGQTAGDGPFTRRCRDWLERRFSGSRAFLTPSCTAALEMCALLLRLQPGDEVIVPSYTFVTTASAFALFGARIIFADISPDTLCLDPALLPQLLSPRTKAVVMVHYAGIAANPQPLADWCASRGIALVEDNAHALGADFGGRPLGTWGSLATLSFHESKNCSCGEGGALLVNDPALVARAEILREKGTNRSAHLRREIAKYSWVDLGSSYLASDLSAAALLAQFDYFETIQSLRHERYANYQTGLAAWAEAQGVRLPLIPEGCAHAAHLFHLLFENQADRESASSWMRAAGIDTYFHYLPLHESPEGLKSGAAPLGCPVTESVSGRLLRLPLYPGLSLEDQSAVIQRLVQWRRGAQLLL